MIRTIALLLAFSTAPLFADKLDPYLGPVKIRHLITVVCAETGVPVYVAAPLLWSESSGNRWARNETSKGYWQLNSKYHRWFSRMFWDGLPWSEYSPTASTYIAIRYLRWLYDIEGNWFDAIIDYKHGINATAPPSEALMVLVHNMLEGQISERGRD